ncbi:MAG: hypothetical protein AAB562_01660, partial [Patescibacteria group bacterium]
MSQKSVKLPWQAEIMHRLLAVDSSDYLMSLYFIFLRYVGQQMTAADVVIMVGRAIDEYAGGMPRGVQDRLYELAPRFIE